MRPQPTPGRTDDIDLRVSGVWATVLAGGAGRRLASVTGGVPKQFWAMSDDGRTLLAMTLARIAPLVRSTQTVVVVDQAHEPYLRRLSHTLPAQRLLRQPCDRGTAAGILFGIMPALESARDPVLLITPSDHGVVDAGGFQAAIRAAVVRVGSGLQPAILFGAEPTEDDGDYGWITPGATDRAPHGVTLRPVASFVEKPPADEAARLRASGAVWNTMVLVIRSSTLLALYRRHLPTLTAVFDQALHLPAPTRYAFLQDQYGQLPARDFSRDVMTPATGVWVHRLPAALGWSDLGTPIRVQQWFGNIDASARLRSA